MKTTKTSLILVFLLCFFNISNAQSKLSAVKIFVPPFSTDRTKVIGLLSIDHFQEENGAIISEINDEDLIKLKASGYRYQILIDDVAANLEKVNRAYFAARKRGEVNMDGSSRVAFEQPGSTINSIIPQPAAFQVWSGAGNLGGYYDFAQMNTAMNNLVATYPTIASKTSLGLSIEGRNIWCIKISDNVATPDDLTEPDVLFIGLQHAREAIGGSSMIFMMQYLCENYATDTRIQNLVNNREIYIIPCMNPDGWFYNESTNPNGGGGWRKNRRIIAGSSPATYQYGVDLNRNWNVDWANCAGAVGGTSCGDPALTTANGTYWGTSPFSEPETQAVRDFIRSKHIVVANDQHSFGPYYSLPFGRPGLHTGADTLTLMDQQWYTSIPALMGKYNGMRAGNSVQALGYEVAGGIKDWFLKGDIGTSVGSGLKTKIYGMTGEGGYGAAAATFWPPAGQIVNLCKGMTYQNLQLLYSAGSYVDLQDVTDISLPATSTGSVSFRVKRLGLVNAPVTITAIPIMNISFPSPAITINSLPTFYDTTTRSISYSMPVGITNGQRVRFAWRIETGGHTWYDTVTKFYNPTQLLFDNMEGATASTNWAITGGWAYSTNGAYTGSKSLTESPGGNYAESSVDSARYLGTFNLADATAAYLTFWTRHRAENFHDKLVIQVSTNGTVWTAIAGKTTVREPGTLEGTTINGIPALTGIKDDWVKEVYDLSAYLTFPALRLRFVFTSDVSSAFFYAEDDGFYIDELKMIKSTIPLVTLPVEFIDFSGKLTTANNVELQWKAIVDEKHSHFVVERSVDGQNFSSLGRVDGIPYKLTDISPAVGINYYRIRQYDFDGNFSYSKTININYDPSRLTITMYPNPARENITLRFNAAQTEKITIQVSDLTGKIIYATQTSIGVVSQEAKINVQSWASQTYIVKIVGDNNVVLSVQKFVKQ